MSLALATLLLAAGPVYAAPEVPDRELAEERGGFALPSGIDVAMTVQSQTAVDGQVVLRTVFAVDRGPATMTIYAPKPGEAMAAVPVAAATTAAGASSTQVTYDARNGIQVTPGLAHGAVTVGGPATPAPTDGLGQVGAGTQTATGLVTQVSEATRNAVRLEAADLTVMHLAGAAYGSVIANTGSDRAIDTVTSLSIDLRNAGPDVLGSAMLRVETVALDAVAGRFR